MFDTCFLAMLEGRFSRSIARIDDFYEHVCDVLGRPRKLVRNAGGMWMISLALTAILVPPLDADLYRWALWVAGRSIIQVALALWMIMTSALV